MFVNACLTHTGELGPQRGVFLFFIARFLLSLVLLISTLQVVEHIVLEWCGVRIVSCAGKRRCLFVWFCSFLSVFGCLAHFCSSNSCVA